MPPTARQGSGNGRCRKETGYDESILVLCLDRVAEGAAPPAGRVPVSPLHPADALLPFISLQADRHDPTLHLERLATHHVPQ